MRLLYEPLNDLPTGFTEVEYLVFTGTQYINTGFKANTTTTKYQTKIEPTNITTTQALFGSRNTLNIANTNNCEVFIYQSQFRMDWVNGDGSRGLFVPVAVDTPYEIEVTRGRGVVNGVVYTSTEHTSTNQDYNFLIGNFTNGSSTPFSGGFIGKLYYGKLYSNDVLVRDFIPALDRNNVPCMYDKVTGKVFYNQGTGSFTYGREIHRVEYLESTGTQYIDTGVKLTNNHSVEVDYQLTSASQNRKGIFGGLVSNGARYGALLSPSNNYLEFGYGSTNVWYQTGIPDTKRHVMKQEKNLLYFDGSLTYTFNTATFTQNFTSPLGNFNYTNYNPASAKYYSSRWWDGDTLVRDFIPAIDENGVGFMFDKVSHTVYLNAGTGAFKYPATQVEYIESTSVGGCFDLGIKYKSSMSIKLKYSRTDMGASGSVLPLSTSTTSPVLYFPALNANAKTDRFVWRRGGYTEQNYYMSFASYPTDDFEVFLDATLDKLYINGTNVKSGMIAGMNGYNSPYQSASNLYVFSIDGSYGGLGKVYYVKIYDTTQVYRDLIPAWKDGSLGFYDKQNDVFYTNTKQSGTFVAGKIQPMKKLRLMIDSKRRLPTGFKEVEYLESTGTQYIDTEYTINTATDEVLFNFQMVSTTLYQWIMGEHDNGARFGVGVGDGTNKRNIAYGATTYKVNDAEIYNSIHYFKANSNGVYLNGTQVHGFETFSSSSTIYLFRLNLSGSNGAAGKIWRYIQKRNGVLIRDMIPCLDQNNTPCMFDLVDGKPYYNLGTGNFTYGHIITPVEYLESDGTGAYIKTGLTANFNTKAEVIFKCNEMVGSPAVLGGRSSASIAAFCIWGKSNAGYVCCNFSNTGVFNSSVTAEANTKYLAVLDNSGYTVNGSKTEITTTTTFTSPELYMFDANGANTSTSGTGNRKLVGKIYGAKIWDNGTLVRSFIPVRDENNVGYMFDEVTGQLFGNAGSGSFGIGNDLPKYKVRFIQDVIPSAYLPLKYLESTGTQYIDLGVGVKSNTVFKATFSIASTATGRSYFGARNSSNERFQIVNSIGIGGGYYLSNTVYPLANQKYEIEMHANGDMYLDGVKRSATTGTFSQVAFGRNLWLFATNYYDSSVGPGASTFWSVIIYEGNVPVRDLYPALRKSDNKPGMYDRITKQFYVNQGTGEFNYEV